MHSLMERNQPPSKFCTHLETWSDKRTLWCIYQHWYSIATALPSPLQKLYTNTMLVYCTFETIQGIVHKTCLQYNTTTFARMYKQTEHHTVIAVPPFYTTLVCNLIMELYQTMVYRTFFGWNGLYNTIPKFTEHIAEHTVQLQLTFKESIHFLVQKHILHKTLEGANDNLIPFQL
jgi:hypothetical protein